MLDGGVRVTSPCPKCATAIPSAREIGVQRQGTIDQGNHCADVLAEVGQGSCGISEDHGVIPSHFQGPPCIFGTFLSVCRCVLAPSINMKPKTAECAPGKRRAVTRIAVYCLFKKTQCLGNVPGRRQRHCISAEIKIVGG